MRYVHHGEPVNVASKNIYDAESDRRLNTLIPNLSVVYDNITMASLGRKVFA